MLEISSLIIILEYHLMNIGSFNITVENIKYGGKVYGYNPDSDVDQLCDLENKNIKIITFLNISCLPLCICYYSSKQSHQVRIHLNGRVLVTDKMFHSRALFPSPISILKCSRNQRQEMTMSNLCNNYGKPLGKRTCLPLGNWQLQLEGGASQSRGRFPGLLSALLLLQTLITNDPISILFICLLIYFYF